MSARRHIDNAERRNRLAIRHGLHPSHRLPDALSATKAMTVLHATEPSSVHLAVHARTDGVTIADVERELYEQRSLVKQLAMRRTLWVFPRDLLPAALGSAAARVADQQRRTVARTVERHSVADDGETWLADASRAVLDLLADGTPRSARELREALPELAGTITTGLDRAWGGTFHLAPRVLTALGAAGLIARGPNAGHWRLGRPTWTLMSCWLGEQPATLPAGEGYAELVRRWLAAFGPGTLEDVQWWLGSTKAAARAALTAVDAVEVSLDGGAVGWVLPEDVEPVASPGPWAALLPTLDPTTMGWKGRGFYLDPGDAVYLFDSNGNAGTTAWWNGRIVGAWVQDDDGVVEVVLLRDSQG
ncbi:MAG TPA: winged helix DNA-binding domain-containing protein, partial [Actinomycetaceae bacterium]|nr:winged helix DNA-binding domain-containing protein [Actinomycetaceae bacterium]